MQKYLIYLGIVLIVIGFAWPWISKLPIGHLPGDIIIDKPNFKVYIPLASMFLLSLLLSLIMWFFRK